MEKENRYTAEEVVRVLRSAGFDINKRTVNYYAFDKKIFEVPQAGKKNFTDVELDKIQAILLLRERTSLSLDEIKDIINTYTLTEIKRQHPKREPQFKSFAASNMKAEYEIEVNDSHIIMLVGDKRFLLGTGATSSIGPASFVFMDNRYSLQASYMGTSIEEISQLIGTPIDVLLGSDILKEFYFIVDIDDKRVTFSDVPLDFTGQPLPVDLVLNVPVVQVEIGGKKRRAFFDISAKVSYLRAELVENYPRIKKENDFYPGLGSFETDIYEIPVKLSDSHAALQFGCLPSSLAIALSMANCDGILGYELFRYYSAMYFNLNGHLVMLKPRAFPLSAYS